VKTDFYCALAFPIDALAEPLESHPATVAVIYANLQESMQQALGYCFHLPVNTSRRGPNQLRELGYTEPMREKLRVIAGNLADGPRENLLLPRVELVPGIDDLVCDDCDGIAFGGDHNWFWSG
jgi:hypothetical protein